MIDDFEVEPAADPVIGPELAAAPDPPRPDRRPARRAHPDPPARDRVDRGRRLRPVRRRLLRPRPPAHAGAGARRRRRAAADGVRRALRRRADQPAPGLRGRAGHRGRRQHPRHPRRPELVGPGRGGDGAGAGLVDRPPGHGQPGRCCRTPRRRCSTARPGRRNAGHRRPRRRCRSTSAGGGSRTSWSGTAPARSSSRATCRSARSSRIEVRRRWSSPRRTPGRSTCRSTATGAVRWARTGQPGTGDLPGERRLTSHPAEPCVVAARSVRRGGSGRPAWRDSRHRAGERNDAHAPGSGILGAR